LQARETTGGKAFAPLADGVSVAVEFGGDGLVGGSVLRGGAEDDAAAEDQGLGRGAGAEKGFELVVRVRGEEKTRAERTWPDQPPCNQGNSGGGEGCIMPCPDTLVQTLAANL
jgi:hypothetical protein